MSCFDRINTRFFPSVVIHTSQFACRVVLEIYHLFRRTNTSPLSSCYRDSFIVRVPKSILNLFYLFINAGIAFSIIHFVAGARRPRKVINRKFLLDFISDDSFKIFLSFRIYTNDEMRMLRNNI